MATINFRGSRADVSRIAQRLAGILSGREPDTLGIGRGFLLALGFAVLSSVKEAYVIKARRGTDAMGIQWPELSPKTVANRRIGPKDIRENPLIAKFVKIRKRESARIRREFKKQEGKLFERFLLSLDAKEARKQAKRTASIRAFREIGLTKVQLLGGRIVDILRDTGVLLNSLSPGRLTGSGVNVSYSQPSGEGGEDQVVDVSPGELIVGTNVAYAATHQFGNPSKRIPRRQFLPDDESQVPEVWWEDWLDISVRSLEAGTRLLFSQGAQ